MSLLANNAQNTQNLFYRSENTKQFGEVLDEVQSYISSKYSALVVDGINNVGSGNDEVKKQVKRYIGKYLLDYRLSVEGMTQEELIDKLYTEMAEFSFLTKYIFGTGIEEININDWDDVEVQYSNGTTVKLDEHFESPDHAINVVRRMLHVSGMVLDNTSPAILGHLSKNIRIADSWMNKATMLGEVQNKETGKWSLSLDGNHINSLIVSMDKQPLKFGDKGDYEGTMYDYLLFISNRIGQNIDYYESQYDSAYATSNALLDSRDAVSGVSETEEGINMMTYQNWYNASSRMMTAMDEALDRLINNTGRVGL